LSDRSSNPRASTLIKVFTPSLADEADTNAQNLTAKEVVARLDPERFHVTLFHEHEPDPRIASRPNTQLLRWRRSGNTARTLLRMLTDVPDVYFFPREGPLDEKFFQLRRWLGWHTAVVTYMVSGGLDRLPPRPGQLRNLRAANLIFGNCQYLTELLHNKLGVPAETIHDGIDARYYFPKQSSNGGPQDARRVLFAGSFRPYKRADLVVKQAACRPDVQFRIAGRGEEEGRCRRMAGQLGCRNVHFLGHLDPENLGEEMRSADVFFFPSELEGHPQVLLQAAGCGLPAIAMKSYHPDAIVDGQTGFLVDGEAQMGKKLELLLKDADLRERMSKAAVQHAANFSWDKVTAQWAKVFAKVVGGRTV
jgi:glycosyltransferase involved in cell wall biosynthesis